MKDKLKKAVLAVSTAFICIGLILCVIGANNGGSFLRAMKYNGADIKIDSRYDNNKGREPYYYNPYGGYGSQGGSSQEEQMREFFKQFGMSDDEIDMFINPYNSQGGYGGRRGNDGENYNIQ